MSHVQETAQSTWNAVQYYRDLADNGDIRTLISIRLCNFISQIQGRPLLGSVAVCRT
jgi:hypothetical protein